MKTKDIELLQNCFNVMRRMSDRIDACRCSGEADFDDAKIKCRDVMEELIAKLEEEQHKTDLEKNAQPCPHCGSQPALVRNADDKGVYGWQLECDFHDLDPVVYDDSYYHWLYTKVVATEKEAIEAWNRLVGKHDK